MSTDTIKLSSNSPMREIPITPVVATRVDDQPDLDAVLLEKAQEAQEEKEVSITYRHDTLLDQVVRRISTFKGLADLLRAVQRDRFIPQIVCLQTKANLNAGFTSHELRQRGYIADVVDAAAEAGNWVDASGDVIQCVRN